MANIEHGIDIDAPADTVWAVVTDFARYPEWNPFMTIAGKPSDGESLEVTIRPGKRTMTFKPTVLAHEPGRQLQWRGRLILPGIFDGEHRFRVEPTGAGSRFVQQERFTGLLVPFLGGMLKDTSLGFVAMNAALKRRAESLTAELTPPPPRKEPAEAPASPQPRS